MLLYLSKIEEDDLFFIICYVTYAWFLWNKDDLFFIICYVTYAWFLWNKTDPDPA